MTLAKRLLVNADDFGLSTAINSGILRSHTDGIVRSTSLVAAGSAFEEAVEIAGKYPALGVGVHLTLVEERAVSQPSEVNSLAPNGSLPRTYGELMKRLIAGGIRRGEIEHELRAQIEKCLSAGLRITHLDSHQHTHTFPAIFEIVAKLGREYKIPGIRIPRGWPRIQDLSADRFLPKCVLCLLARWDASWFKLDGCVAAAHFAGLFESGDLTQDKLSGILRELRDGTTELVCHPGCDDTSPQYLSWNLRRQTELATLTSESVKKSIRELDIELINYTQL